MLFWSFFVFKSAHNVCLHSKQIFRDKLFIFFYSDKTDQIFSSNVYQLICIINLPSFKKKNTKILFWHDTIVFYEKYCQIKDNLPNACRPLPLMMFSSVNSWSFQTMFLKTQQTVTVEQIKKDSWTHLNSASKSNVSLVFKKITKPFFVKHNI